VLPAYIIVVDKSVRKPRLSLDDSEAELPTKEPRPHGSTEAKIDGKKENSGGGSGGGEVGAEESALLTENISNLQKAFSGYVLHKAASISPNGKVKEKVEKEKSKKEKKDSLSIVIESENSDEELESISSEVDGTESDVKEKELKKTVTQKNINGNGGGGGGSGGDGPLKAMGKVYYSNNTLNELKKKVRLLPLRPLAPAVFSSPLPLYRMRRREYLLYYILTLLPPHFLSSPTVSSPPLCYQNERSRESSEDVSLDDLEAQKKILIPKPQE